MTAVDQNSQLKSAIEPELLEQSIEKSQNYFLSNQTSRWLLDF